MKTRRHDSVQVKMLPLAAALTTLVVSGSANALEFDTGNPDLQVRWDNTIRYNVAQRVKERDSKIGNSAIADEGTYSFDKGDLVAKRFDLLSEFDVVYNKTNGLRVSAAAWYDAAYGDRSRSNPNAPLSTIPSYTNNEYSDYTKRYYHGPSGEILDAFVFGSVDAGSVPVALKAGRHTVFWGESLFLNGALHGISYAQMPLDLQKGFATPGTEAKELFRPTKQLSMQAQLTDNLSLAAQYFFQWESDRFPEGGTYLGPADFVFDGPDRQFLSAGLGFANRASPVEPKQRGEHGLALRWSPAAIDGTVGFYYRNYADKIPQVLLTKVGAASTSEYRNIYADDIKLYGVSLAKNIAGVSVGAEVSYRENTPLSAKVLGISPTGVPTQGETSGPRGDTWHALINTVGLIPKTFLFDQASWAAELTWSRWDKVRSGANLFQAEGFAGCSFAGKPVGDKWDGCATKSYVGAGVSFTPTWYQVLAGVDLSAPLSYSQGVKGNAATVFGGNEDMGNYTVGLSADIVQKYRVDLKYVAFFGKYRDNGTAVTTQNGFTTLLKDRDFVSLTLKTTF